MPANPQTTRWPAAPHTCAKIHILKSYLHAWFGVMGQTQRGKDLSYVDGFAGPGSYTNEPEGSPLAALSALANIRRRTESKWIAGKVHAAFFEDDHDRFRALQDALMPFKTTDFVVLRPYNLPFEDAMARLRAEFPHFFSSSVPSFAFIDPFGVKGFKFETIRGILQNPKAEVLINFDGDGVARVALAGSAADHASVLTEIYGSGDWQSELDLRAPMHALVRAAMTLYRKRLLALPRVKYVFPFEMRTHQTSIDYYLIFASQHPLGLEKMKEAMKSVDRTGTYTFCDASLGQGELFRADDPTTYAGILAKSFAGRTVPFEELRTFVLNETPFIRPGAVLKVLESSGRLIVNSRNSKRRKGSFKPEEVIDVTFKE